MMVDKNAKFLSNAQSLALMAIVVTGLVFNSSVVKDVLL